MGFGDTDLVDDCDEGGEGCKAALPSAVSCSICLEAVTDNGDRSWAKLQCGHQFHLGELIFQVILKLTRSDLVFFDDAAATF